MGANVQCGFFWCWWLSFKFCRYGVGGGDKRRRRKEGNEKRERRKAGGKQVSTCWSDIWYAFDLPLSPARSRQRIVWFQHRDTRIMLSTSSC
jgi:hypothetical protein